MPEKCVVRVTTYRYKVLAGPMRERLREIIRQTCAEMGVHIVRGVLGGDHVHMFLSTPPRLALSDSSLAGPGPNCLWRSSRETPFRRRCLMLASIVVFRPPRTTVLQLDRQMVDEAPRFRRRRRRRRRHWGPYGDYWQAAHFDIGKDAPRAISGDRRGGDQARQDRHQPCRRSMPFQIGGACAGDALTLAELGLHERRVTQMGDAGDDVESIAQQITRTIIVVDAQVQFRVLRGETGDDRRQIECPKLHWRGDAVGFNIWPAATRSAPAHPSCRIRRVCGLSPRARLSRRRGRRSCGRWRCAGG